MSVATLTASADTFAAIDPSRLDVADEAFLDALAFGVVRLSATGITEVYNETEMPDAGMRRDGVLGQPFFLMARVCMNNYLGALRLEDEEVIGSVLDDVLTIRMRPTPAKLRLLKRPARRLRSILVQRRSSSRP